MSRSSKRTKLHDNDDDDSDAIWLLPDNIEDDDEAMMAMQEQMAALRNTRRTKGNATMATTTTTTTTTRPSSKPSTAIVPVDVITTPEILQQQQANASFITTLIVSHPMYAKLTAPDKTVVLRVENPVTGFTEIIFCRGITMPLKEKIWSNWRFHARPKRNPNGTEHIAGTPWVYEDAQGGPLNPVGENANDVNDDGNGEPAPLKKKPRRSMQAIRHDALESGSRTHKKLELYNKVYIDTMKQYGNTEKVATIFKEQLRRDGLGDSEEDMKDIDAILNLYNIPEYQFIPVATELPVCDTGKIHAYLDYRHDRNQRVRLEKTMGVISTPARRSSATPTAPAKRGLWRSTPYDSPPRSVSNPDDQTYGGPVLYGTLIDALVYCPRQGALGFIELKTSRGSFVKSSGKMAWPLDWLSNSSLNCANVQLSLSIEYFKRTYGSILKQNGIPGNLYGFIINVEVPNEEGGDVNSEIHTLTPQLQEKIIASLRRTDFLADIATSTYPTPASIGEVQQLLKRRM